MPTTMSCAFIGIGSNLQDPQAQAMSAIAAIDAADELILAKRSSLYSSPPMGPPDQPCYINAVVALRTSLTSLELLEHLQLIEREHGRVRRDVHWGPRTLDLDILLFGNETVTTERLRIPHPGMLDRAFVILPLAEIAPTQVLPNGETAMAFARSMPPGGLVCLSSAPGTQRS